MKIQIILDINYDLNGTHPDEIKDILKHSINRIAGDGGMTSDTEAEVDTWSYTIKDNTDIWGNDLTQFARLLSEIYGVGLTEGQREQILESMDIDNSELEELFIRAEKQFDLDKI